MICWEYSSFSAYGNFLKKMFRLGGYPTHLRIMDKMANDGPEPVFRPPAKNKLFTDDTAGKVVNS